MDLSTERFFVTGATGFIGACLVRRLVEMRCEVHALLRPESNPWRLEGVDGELHLHRGDLNQAERLRDLIADIQPSVIHHLAVHGAYPTQTNADEIIVTDVFGTWNLLKACAEVDYKVFLNAGSSSEYGSKRFAMRETDLLEPGSYYAVAKAAQTLVAQHMARADRRPINTFRFFSVYGPWEEPTRLIPALIRRCLEGRSLDMVSPDTARDFVFVEDAVNACLQIGQLTRIYGEVFNIGTGVQSNMRDVTSAVMKATGTRVKVNWGTMPARIWDTETWVADVSKVRNTLGWAPTTGLQEGIQKTVLWYREQGSQFYDRKAAAGA